MLHVIELFTTRSVTKWPLLRLLSQYPVMGLLPDTQDCGLRMHRECWERFPRHRLQRKPPVSNPGTHHGTCVTHVPWWMPGSLTRGDGENVPGIPGACTTRSFVYLVRGPCGVVSATWGSGTHWCDHRLFGHQLGCRDYKMGWGVMFLLVAMGWHAPLDQNCYSVDEFTISVGLHSAPVPHPTVFHFGVEMCAFMFWCGELLVVKWELCGICAIGSKHSILLFVLINKIVTPVCKVVIYYHDNAQSVNTLQHTLSVRDAWVRMGKIFSVLSPGHATCGGNGTVTDPLALRMSPR